MRRTLDALDLPYRDLPTVLIGGTNGKGSTANLLASMASAAGYRVGLFTSPHLQRYEEQVRIADEIIDAEQLLELWCRVQDAAERICPGEITDFEVLTAAAIVHFWQQKVDLAICEVGMGGRDDSTNVLEPQLSIVTSLGWDHATFLGDTPAEIAVHKAGIFRPGRPALIARTEPIENEQLLLAEAQRLGANAGRVRQEVGHLETQPMGDGWQQVHLRTPTDAYSMSLALAGSHQLDNLATAVRAAEELRRLGWRRLDRSAIQQGVAACRWPGRLETLRVGERTVLLDAAHNEQGASALANHLLSLDLPFDLFFGALADKNIDAMLKILSAKELQPASRNSPERKGRLWLVRPSSPRAWNPEAYEVPVSIRHRWHIEIPQDPAAGLERAMEQTAALLVVSGSLRLVGDVRSLLFDRFDPLSLVARLQ